MSKSVAKRWSDFVKECDRTIFDSCKNYEYLVSGLNSEMGEVFGKLKKYIRGDFGAGELHDMVKCEIGDCMWYIAMISKYCMASVDDAVSVQWIYRYVVDGGGSPFEECGRATSAIQLAVPVYGKTVVPSDIVTLVNALERVAGSFSHDLGTCCDAVIEKLSGRDKIGTLKGDGDGVVR